MNAQACMFSPHHLTNDRGTTLALALGLLAVLTVVGATAVTLTSTDLFVSGNYKTSQQAFYNAEAGVQVTLASIPPALRTGALTLDGSKETEAHTAQLPDGFAYKQDIQFRLENVKNAEGNDQTFFRVATTRNYFFRVTGLSPDPKSTINSALEVVIQRRTLFPYGMFGDERVDLNTAGAVYSYDSRITPNPQPEDSSGEADVGSNGIVSAYSNTSRLEIDGEVALGEDSAGTPGKFEFRTNPGTSYAPPTTVPLTDATDIQLVGVPRVNPDPLEAEALVGEARLDYIAINDNSSVPEISANNTISTSATLTAGNYYLEDVTLGSGSTLTIDTKGATVNIYVKSMTLQKDATFNTTGGGKVNIYLDGKMEAQFRSAININGPPTSFLIYSRSEEPLTFYHVGDFKGMVYAPHAKVTMHNTYLKSYGLLWGREISTVVDWGPTTFYFDTALKDLFLSNDVSMISWKELRD